MSKYSEKKERQAKVAAKATIEAQALAKDEATAKAGKLLSALVIAKTALDTAMVIKELCDAAKGGAKSDLEAVRGRIVSARDKVSSAIARLPEEAK